MPIRRTGDRRTDLLRGETGLLERGIELDAVEELLAPEDDEGSRALLVSGAPGLGKTRLFGVALDRARSRGLLALRAAGSELEQNVAFGVAGRLLLGLLAAVPAEERAGLLRDAPEGTRALSGQGSPLGLAGVEDGLTLSHGLFVVLAAAAEARTILIGIDDLQWCDGTSLAFVHYLLNRVSELSVRLVLTTRPLETVGEELDPIALHPAVRELTLAPLGPQAVRAMVADALGERHAEALSDVCLEMTGGNPFYLRELLLTLSEDPEGSTEQLERGARSLAPENVTRSLRVRVGRLGPEAGALARAVAVLGDEVPLRRAASLADLKLPEASAAADALAAADVLWPDEPLRFLHPLIRTALEQDIPASQRAGAHLRAARLMSDESEGAERIAAHLLLGRPEADWWAVEQLRTAAAEARSRGAALSAVRYLERALAEPPSDELRAEVLGELGSAEAALGLEAADEHLTLASQTTENPRIRAEVALAKGGALFAQGQPEPAARSYREGLEQLAGTEVGAREQELRDSLQTALVLSMATVPALQADARRISAEVIERDRGQLPTHSQRLLLAQATVEAAFGGRPATDVIDLATRAWDEGRLLEGATAYGPAWTLVSGALSLAGDLERSLEVADAAADHARRQGAPLAFATATFMRALPQLWQGSVDSALAELELARDARRYGWQQYARSAAAQYCLCMIEKGQLDTAEAVLSQEGALDRSEDGEYPVVLYALAELRRAQGRPQEAYETALRAGRAAEAAFTYLGYCPWRASAAQSALTLGQRDQAGELIEQELARLETTQVLHERIRALRLAGLCEGGPAGLDRLREAVELGEGHPPRLETIHALIALGSAVRRSNQRAEARRPLERAYDLARRGGASAQCELARTELAASGIRRTSEALSGPASLTASELRIAQLAAAGQSNREISAALFVTPKTVEYHLRNCYRKLDIQTRRELARALQQ